MSHNARFVNPGLFDPGLSPNEKTWVVPFLFEVFISMKSHAIWTNFDVKSQEFSGKVSEVCGENFRDIAI